MTLEREVRVDGLPSYMGVDRDAAEKAAAIARKWLYLNFEPLKVEKVLLVHPKGFAFLLFSDEKQAKLAQQVESLEWENGKEVEIKVQPRRENRRRPSNIASASSTTAAPAAHTGGKMSDSHGHGDAAPKAATPKEPDKKKEEKKPTEEKRPRRKGIGRWIHEAGEIIAGGAITNTVWEGMKFVARQVGSEGASAIAEKAKEHYFGSSPRDEFALHVESKLTSDQMRMWSELLADRDWFNPTQVDKFYELSYDVMSGEDPKDPKKKAVVGANADSLKAIIERALKEPTHELQVLQLGALYVPKEMLPVGKMKKTFDNAHEALKSGYGTLDEALIDSGITNLVAQARRRVHSRRR